MSLSNEYFADLVNTVRSEQAAKLEVPKSLVPRKPKRVYTKAEVARRDAKKEEYMAYKKVIDDRQKELEEKYRDRAKERREGKGDTAENEATLKQLQALTKAAQSAAQSKLPTNQKLLFETKRKLLIDESKYLGGDMEHTHLVKGLDFALLKKKRAEIADEEREKEEAEMERIANAAMLRKKLEPEMRFKTDFAKRIHDSVFKDPFDIQKLPKLNRTFLPGRMAWQFDTSKKSNDNPISIIRSEIELSTGDREAAFQIENKSKGDGLSTNEIVLNKLIQILSYIRNGQRSKLEKKRKTIEQEEAERQEKIKLREERKMKEERKKYEEERDRRHEKERRRDRREDRDDRRESRRSRRDKDGKRRKERSNSPEKLSKKSSKDEKSSLSKSSRHKLAHSSTKERRKMLEKEIKRKESSDDNDDIFSDAGVDYEPDVENSESRKAIMDKKAKKEAQEPIFKDGNEIEESLPTAPKKLKTTDQIIEQAKKMAKMKRKGVQDESELDKNVLPEGAIGFGSIAEAGYGAEYDDDDRMDDAPIFKKRSGRMNEISKANKTWQQVNGIINKEKSGNKKKK